MTKAEKKYWKTHLEHLQSVAYKERKRLETIDREILRAMNFLRKLERETN